jgi:MFS family permease
MGAALVARISISLVTTAFAEGPERHKALGVISALASTGFAAGAILGGLLTAGPGWGPNIFTPHTHQLKERKRMTKNAPV